MDKFLVHRNGEHSGPGIHAIVIGVGEYPHLISGDDERTESHEGMGQLTSPPVSARAIADWLIGESEHPDQPELSLLSLSLLLSDSNSQEYTHPVDQSQHSVELATVENCKKAIKAWKKLGDENEDNLLLFFFCGHGVSKGTETTILLRDYGADEDNPLDGAIDFSQFRLGMRLCKALRQIYFVDVCRTASDTILGSGLFKGQVVILPDITEASDVSSPTYYSTLQGNKAFGRAGEPSYFTEFLLKSLQGAAADNNRGDDDEWWISTPRLQTTLANYLHRAAQAGEALAQVPESEGAAPIEFHRLKGKPVTDVYVSCLPPDQQSVAKLECFSADQQPVASRDSPSSDTWELSLPLGKFLFAAEVPGKPKVSKSRNVRPPFKNVPIEIS